MLVLLFGVCIWVSLQYMPMTCTKSCDGEEAKFFRKQAAKAERMARTVADAEISERYPNMAKAYRSQANVLKAKKKPHLKSKKKLSKKRR
jgi:hypothetical protein